MTITTNNYEWYFYKYAEGELDAEGRVAVEDFALQHPELAEELAFYDHDLKLQKETLVCPNKDSLLHREAKVVSMWHWAAAACVAVLLVCGGLGVRSAIQRNASTVKDFAVERTLPTRKDAEGNLAFAKPAESGRGHSQQTLKDVQKIANTTTATSHSLPTAGMQPVVVEDDRGSVEIATSVQASRIQGSSVELPLLAVEGVEAETVSDGFVVIEYNDMIVASNAVVEEEADSAEVAKASARWRSLRSRVGNTIRDYAYRTYAHTRGELLALADR